MAQTTVDHRVPWCFGTSLAPICYLTNRPGQLCQMPHMSCLWERELEAVMSEVLMDSNNT